MASNKENGLLLTKLKKSNKNTIISSKFNFVRKNENNQANDNKTQTIKSNINSGLHQSDFDNNVWDNLVKSSTNKVNNDNNLLDISKNTNDEELTTYYDKFKQVNSSSQSFCESSYSSIIPFLLIQDKQLHRGVISEIDLNKWLNVIDNQNYKYYYQKGLILFYYGDYLSSYNFFKLSVSLFESEIANKNLSNKISMLLGNIYKWLAFAAMIVLFCQDKSKVTSIDLCQQLKCKLFEPTNSNLNNKIQEKINPLFICFNRRKEDSNKSSLLFLSEKFDENKNYIITNLTQLNVDTSILCQEIEYCIHQSLLCECNRLECNWLILYILIYLEYHPTSNIFYYFKKFSALQCIKNIKSRDKYLSYIAYDIYQSIKNNSYSSSYDIYNELISEYPYRVEGYIMLYILMTKKNFHYQEETQKKIIDLIEHFTISSLKIDNSFYSYILLIQSRCQYIFKKKLILSMKMLEKLYVFNMNYPIILFLFSKWGAESKDLNLKQYIISILSQIHFLLYQDKKYLTYYWTGFVYHNMTSIIDVAEIYKNYKAFVDSMKEFKSHSKKFIQCNEYIKDQSIEQYIKSLDEFKNDIQNISKEKEKKKEIYNLYEQIRKMEQLSKKIPKFRFNKDYYRAYVMYKLNPNEEKQNIIHLYTSIHLSNDYSLLEKIRSLFHLWKYLKEQKNVTLQYKLAYYLCVVSSTENIPLPLWMKSFSLLSKSLIKMKKFEQSISVITSLLDIYIHNETYKTNCPINISNFYLNYEQAMNYYSKSNIFYKNKFIIDKAYQKSKISGGGKLKRINITNVNYDSVNSLKKEYYSENLNFVNEENNVSSDTIIDTEEKLELFLDKRNKEIIVPKDNYSFIMFLADPHLLYLVGKIIAICNIKNEKNYDEIGLKCLDEYEKCNINKINSIINPKFLFWKGILYIRDNSISLAKKNLELFEKEKKNYIDGKNYIFFSLFTKELLNTDNLINYLSKEQEKLINYI